MPLPSVAGTHTRGQTRFARILAHVLAPQSLVLSLTDVMNSAEITKATIEFAVKHGLGKRPELKHLYNAITSSPKHERYKGLMGVFAVQMREDRLKVQTFTGRLLLKINPKATERCEEAIFRLLPHWDVSAEEVVFYLRKQFGKENMLTAINNLRAGQLSDLDFAQLDTVVHWLGCCER